MDFDYLESYTGGDRGLIAEVLGLFQSQARVWSTWLSEPDEEGLRDLAHTIKGSARGIGATALGDAADRVEQGATREVPALQSALAEALAAIDRYLNGAGDL